MNFFAQIHYTLRNALINLAFIRFKYTQRERYIRRDTNAHTKHKRGTRAHAYVHARAHAPAQARTHEPRHTQTHDIHVNK